MKDFKIAKASKLGDYDQKYGQVFWCEVQEQLEPVKFNLMEGDVRPGDLVTCEEVMLKTSTKGIDYHQLKKVKIAGAGVPRENTAAPSDSKLEQVLELVRENNKMLKQLTIPNEPSDPVFDESGAPIDEPSW